MVKSSIQTDPTTYNNALYQIVPNLTMLHKEQYNELENFQSSKILRVVFKGASMNDTPVQLEESQRSFHLLNEYPTDSNGLPYGILAVSK